MNRNFFSYLILLLCGLQMMLTACQDDLSVYPSEMPEGETMVSIDVNFEPFAANTLQSRAKETVAPPGKGMDILSDLCLLAYDKDGNLMKIFSVGENSEDGEIMAITPKPNEIDDADRTNEDASNNQKAEDKTKCFRPEKKIKLPFGEYYLIAVANLRTYRNNAGEIEECTSTKDFLTKVGREKYETLDALRGMKVQWFANNYLYNCEMFGFFISEDNKVVPNASSSFRPVRIDRPNMTLHTWLRRCASKITIDFDGSELRENVYVYIEKAEIFDIASDCTLGFGVENPTDEINKKDFNNAVLDESTLLNRKTSTHHIAYGLGDDHNKWPCITKGSPKIVDATTKEIIDFHAQDKKALFFYENMQGTAPNGKIPVPDLENGGVANAGNTKDGVPCGTYIQVTAHYHSDANGNISDGPIKYRFMIGKDVEADCNAERNYHYKLTLKLRGNANDYDWHIDYKDEKGFDVPNPWYVSYLYSHKAILPFKYTPDKDWRVVKMQAEIIKNPWFPSDISESNLTNPNIAITPVTPVGDDSGAYTESVNQENWNGFLSLRETDKPVVTDIDAGTAWPGYNKGNSSTINKKYYLGEVGAKINRSKREYFFDGTEDTTNKDNEAYTYHKDGNKYTFNIPLFTRAKVLVKQTGYSGNNPFVGYQRVARVRLTVTLRKVDENGKYVTDAKGKYEETSDTQDVNVVQVRRIVNPKGVYRRAGNYEPFQVKMMWLNGDEATSFTPVVSHGPWKADIIGDANFITLNGKKTVSGSTNTNIDFTINFNHLSTGNKNAIVRILYNNYTCTHLVFVRQGYEAQALTNSTEATDFTHKDGGATPVVWETCNMISRNVQASDPRDEGSMFKFGTSGSAIDAINNVYKDNQGRELYRNLTEAEFDAYKGKAKGPFQLVTEKKLNENEYESILNTNTTDWSNITVSSEGFTAGKMAYTATVHHFEQLYLSKNLQYGYGVLYADGATTTQAEVSMAYGYYRRDTDSGDSPKGMRGMFTYYWDGNEIGGSPFNGKNIFFPIGRSGYGHRKNYKEGADGKSAGNGILRYAASRGEANADLFSKDAPLFVSIYRRPGAIYWARNKVEAGTGEGKGYLIWNGNEAHPTNDGHAMGLDINYFSFDVNAIGEGNVNNGNDACFVRCVKE